MILTNPIILNESEENQILLFTINNINVSLANALRRVILSNIPCIVIKSQPYTENKINIIHHLKNNHIHSRNYMSICNYNHIHIHIDNHMYTHMNFFDQHHLE